MATHAKIAIFGANGYIGRHMSRHFLGLGVSVDAFDVQPESKVASVHYETCDICDVAFWERFHVKDKARHAWRYRALVEAFAPLSDTFAYRELAALVQQGFPQ